MPETPASLTRRSLLKSGVLGGALFAFGPGLYQRAFAAAPATPGPGPYGPVGAFDANGIALPQGFTSREIARGGRPVAGYPWHFLTDGQATFPTADGGWILVANSEMPNAGGGGASAVEFAPDGSIRAARRILAGTSRNCAGGPTPWGTWLSCEEFDGGQVWECDPAGTAADAVVHPAMGTFSHESVSVDPFREQLYLTEDVSDGCFYRFTPTDYPDLSSGLLEVATVADDGRVTWTEVPRPNEVLPTPTRDQVPGATRFDGGEGTWFDGGVVFFTTKGDRKVWAYDTVGQRMEIVYDRARAGDGTPLRAVDNVTVSEAGDIYVCEDGDNFEICLITPDRQVATFMRLDPAVHSSPSDNETVGVVFDPSGRRMYFGAQRSFDQQGVVYEVAGPFRSEAGAPAGIVPGPAPDRTDGTPAGAAPGGTGTAAGTAPRAASSAPLTARDRIAPWARLRFARALTARTLRRRGLRLTLELDEPAVVDARLTVLGRTVRRRTTVAVRGRVGLLLRPDTTTTRRLGRLRRPAVGTLVLTLRDQAGNTRTVRRRVRVTARFR